MRAPTGLVSINHVGTGVFDRPLTQPNLRTVREAGPYEHRVRLCEIKDPATPELIGMKSKKKPPKDCPSEVVYLLAYKLDCKNLFACDFEIYEAVFLHCKRFDVLLFKAYEFNLAPLLA